MGLPEIPSQSEPRENIWCLQNSPFSACLQSGYPTELLMIHKIHEKATETNTTEHNTPANTK